MGLIEIIVLVSAVSIVVAVFGKMIYRKIKGLPNSECACCSKDKTKGLLNEYHKKYPNK